MKLKLSNYSDFDIRIKLEGHEKKLNSGEEIEINRFVMDKGTEGRLNVEIIGTSSSIKASPHIIIYDANNNEELFSDSIEGKREISIGK